jgi:hypothetical protein
MEYLRHFVADEMLAKIFTAELTEKFICLFRSKSDKIVTRAVDCTYLKGTGPPTNLFSKQDVFRENQE